MNPELYFTASTYSGLSPIFNEAINGGNGSFAFWGTLSANPSSLLITLILSVLTVAGMWKMFQKAGKPGWASIIPIYNIVIMLEIAKKPIWWVILYFIPLVNLVVGLIVIFDIAKEFGKGIGFAIGMIFLPFIFFPILGFGKSAYANAPAAI